MDDITSQNLTELIKNIKDKKRKVLWMLFDGFDYEIAFDKNDTSSEFMKNFKELKNVLKEFQKKKRKIKLKYGFNHRYHDSILFI